MGQVRKIKAGLVKISVNDFVGEDGNVFFDVEDGVMRLSDGTTPGGIPLSSGGGEGGASTFRQLLDTPSSFSGFGGTFVKVNPQASAIEFVDVDLFDGDYTSLTNTPTLFDPSDITQSLIPRTTETIDLGSESARWRDLYLSGNTIFLGTVQISKNELGGVNLPNNSRINGRKVATDIKDLDDSEGRLSNSGTSDYNELTNLPTLFSGAYADLTDKPTIPTDVSDLTDTTNLLAGGGGGSGYSLPIASLTVLGGIKIGTGLSIDGSGLVTAFSGSYNDLTNLPTLFDGAYSSLTGTPSLFSGAYADLTGAPTIPADVSDLTDTTNLLDHFSGSYNDLTDKPTIPTVPTTISSFTNDSGYITDYTVTQADVTAHQAALSITESQISDLQNYLTSVSEVDVTQHQAALSITESQISDLQDYLTSVAFADLTATPTTIAGYGITDAFDGAYSSLTGAPTTVSSFTNDAGYLVTVAFADLTTKPTTLSGYGITDAATSIQGTKADTALQPNTAFDVRGSVFADDSTLLVDAVNATIPYSVLSGLPTTLSGFGITDAYTSTQVDSAITSAVNEILGDAPELLDTLGEIADAVGDDANFVTTINTAISLKANTSDLAVVATSGSYNDLTDQPDVSDLADRDNLLAAAAGVTEEDLFTYSLIF